MNPILYKTLALHKTLVYLRVWSSLPILHLKNGLQTAPILWVIDSFSSRLECSSDAFLMYPAERIQSLQNLGKRRLAALDMHVRDAGGGVIGFDIGG